MGNKKIENYFVGLDIGTDSVGYAVTDQEYKLLKHGGEPMWGSAVFKVANTKAERRSFRTARRRLDRRQQRVALTQEIFAKEIAKVDERFFIRIKESGLYRGDTSTDSSYFLFEDVDFTDLQYHDKYPTIHHLIRDLMYDQSAKDVRFVYLAVAWLMAHRGHFLNEVDKTNISGVLDFDSVYENFESCCEDQCGRLLWECDAEDFKKKLLLKLPVTKKEKAFYELLNNGKKFKNSDADSISRAAVVKLLSGGKIKPDSIFLNSDYAETDSLSLTMPEEDFSRIISELDEDGEFLIKLRALYDWSLLAEILSGEKTISDAKVKVYDQHGKDLQKLKCFVKKYIPGEYNSIFRDNGTINYAAYSGHNTKKKCDKEEFSDFLNKKLKDIEVGKEDEEFYTDMTHRLALRKFLPKQVDGDNRVIPYQLYWDELNKILENAKEYLSFLKEVDESGYSNAEKLLSVFEFRIPYYVGPLRTDNSQNSWMVRKADATGKIKIYPWNFDDMVDLDASEENFINRMTNRCTYLPGEDVIPKCSLLYSKFMVLNEINNIKVNDIRIPVEVKWQIYEKFKEYKRVSVKRIEEVLAANGCMKEGDILSGIDQTIKSSLSSYHAFEKMLKNEILSEADVEEIIEYITYSEDKGRLKKWIEKKYPGLSESDQKYILHLKFKDFGRFSKRFLTGIEGVDKETGEITTIIDVLWNKNDNLMQILSDRYTFAEMIEDERQKYYAENEWNIDSMLDDMYISNSVRRPIYRTLAVMKDIKKATKADPKCIFIEMARGGGQKGKRTKSRRDQIKEFYDTFGKEEVRELSRQLDDKSDNELQSETLFLYFTQMGKCMYSGESINIDDLKTSRYNVDHIYPQSKVKDDSLKNKVLVLSELNERKGDGLVPAEYKNKMEPMWNSLKEHKLISDEKYKRLRRNIPFTEDELQGFINRQLVETRQSTKALSKIFQILYSDTEIVYVKAGLVSDFRKEFDMLKSRIVNDFHHGKDAYLNIVCGNVYHCRFTKNFYIKEEYSLKTKTIFTNPVYDGKIPVWSGKKNIAEVRNVIAKNNLHYTKMAFERKGGLFDQQPKKAPNGSVPRKKDLPIEKYGGYDNSTASFFLLVKYRMKTKSDIIFMPVDLYAAGKIMKEKSALIAYAKKNLAWILGKDEKDIEILGFPMGMKKIKINTIISLDGFRTALASKSNKGKALILSSMEALKLDLDVESYIKKLERFAEKKNGKIIQKIDEKYDKITDQENINLYNILSEKLKNRKYGIIKIISGNAECMDNSREMFKNMAVEEQVALLIKILEIFKSGRSTTCALKEIKGTIARISISSKLSNVKKHYNDVRLLDVSPSGIYEKASDNLLELL